MTVPQTPNRRSLLPTRHWSYKYLATLAAVIALIRCASIVKIYNHTTDELAHIAGSVGLYETGRNLYMVEHPTLPRLVVGLALKAAGVRYPDARDLAGVQSRPDANLAGADIVFRGDVPYWTVLATARLANLFFAAILLLYVYLLGKYLANSLVAMLATLFVSLDPNFLAHSALVTTDIPAAAGFIAATYHALRFAARPNWRTTIIAAIALGLAMSCKFTVVLLAPPIILLILIRAVRHAKGDSPDSQNFARRVLHYIPRLRMLVAVPAITLLTLWATYLFNMGRLEDQHLFDEDVKGWKHIPQWVKAAPIPMPAMPLGVMFMAALAKTGFPCYFNGQINLTGHLAYFPEAIALKTPAAAVVAFALAFVACVLAGRKNRRPILLLCLFLPPSLLLLTAMTGKLQIGIRHILPVIPFIYLFGVFCLHRGKWIYALLPLILLSAFESARAHPDYLPFFNVLAGGSQNGEKYLADSNLDWGQDMARLANYIKQTGRTDYTTKVSGVRVADLTQFLGLDPNSRERDIEQLKQHPHGLLALGINAKLRLEGFTKENNGTPGPDYTWVNKYPLIARIGQSIEVYDLDRR